MNWVNILSILLGIAFSLYLAYWMYKENYIHLSLFFALYIGILIRFFIPFSLYHLVSQLTWAIGPLLYLVITQNTENKKTTHYYHFIFFGIALILGIRSELLGYKNSPIIIVLLSPLIRALHSTAYIFLSALEVKNDRWQKMMVVAMALLISASYAYDFRLLSMDVVLPMIVFGILVVGYISIKYIRNLPVLVEKTSEEKIEDEQEIELVKRMYAKILEKINEDQLYLNQSIKLSDLNEALNISEKLVSKAINIHAKENFNAFINRFRVKHATTLINSEKFSFYTIDAIAEESGFSNKVSFYKAFKRIEGVAPSIYRQNALNGIKQTTNSLP